MDRNISKRISKPTEKVRAAEEERARTSKKRKNNDGQGQTVQKNGGDGPVGPTEDAPSNNTDTEELDEPAAKRSRTGSNAAQHTTVEVTPEDQLSTY